EMLTEPQKEMSFDEIKTFFKTRIQTSPARNDKDQTLRIPLKDGGTICVPYWTCVKNNTELLLPDGFKGKPAREIMKYAVCMEIVPFRSNGEEGVTNAKNVCWNDFTRDLLELSGASVIVLVGDKVLDSFVSNIAPKAMGTLTAKQIYRIKIGNKDRLIVKVDFMLGKIRRFKGFFDDGVIVALQNAVASSPFVQKALQPPVNN
ncbi:MAG: hypothetical protein IJ587_04205, partial [Synergistaceae bacterium]|nr:hypothetical protein [Synergistaceae bacterium]